MVRRCVVLLGLVLVGCGEDKPAGVVHFDASRPEAGMDGGGDGSSIAEAGGADVETVDGCVVITAGDLSPGRLGDDFAELWAEVSPALGGEGPDRLVLRLRKPAGGDLLIGRFDLATGDDSRGPAQCEHCVEILEDHAWDGHDTTNAARRYVQRSGEMLLNVTASPPGYASSGVLADVRLDEYDATAGSFVSGGRCVHLRMLGWNTLVPAGTHCESAFDCGNVRTTICDPQMSTCQPSHCQMVQQCRMNEVCSVQARVAPVLLAGTGACYGSCLPFFASSCGTGLQCVATRVDGLLGACLEQGGAPDGETCTSTDLATGCGEGHACVQDGSERRCRAFCDPFGAALTPCPEGQRCVMSPTECSERTGCHDALVGAVCLEQTGDPAALGGVCAAPEWTPCGDDGHVLRGVCVLGTDGRKTCVKRCREDRNDDCGPSGRCTAPDAHGAGICFS